MTGAEYRGAQVLAVCAVSVYGPTSTMLTALRRDIPNATFADQYWSDVVDLRNDPRTY